MSKVFIQNGTGSTATLENAHNEKIPVYDTLQDAEADLTDLEENQIVATNEMVVADSVKAYIRNQNLLSDWEDITFTTTDTTMPYDGYLQVFVYTSSGYGYATYTVTDGNNIQHRIGGGSYLNYFTGGVFLAFKKGDRIRRASVGVNTVLEEKVRYYKQRDYTGR